MIRGSTWNLTGNPLADAYLEGDQKAIGLFDCDVHHPNFAKERANEVTAHFTLDQRQALVQAMRQATERVTGISKQSSVLLDKLALPDCLTVVTGQQAGIFTGPLYTLYKAVTAVAYAAYYEKLLQRPVVPVFWVAGEDHDFQEVADAWYITEQGELVRAHLREQPYVRTPVGLHRITSEEFRRLLEELSVRLPEGLYREELLQTLAAAYGEAGQMVDGFIRLLAKWMEGFPILFVNPLDRGFRRLMSDAFRAVLEHPTLFQAAAAAGDRAVRELGYKPQVELTPRHTHMYLIEHGKRSALDYDPETAEFSLRDSGRNISKQELLERLENSPQDFSAGVLFRPVTQDFLLPVLAYVGGAAEIAYHGMLKSIFAAVGRKIPPLHMRQRAFLLTRQVDRALTRLQLQTDEVLDDNFVFTKLLDSETRDLDQKMESLNATLLDELSKYREELLEMDPQLARAFAKTEMTLTKGIERLSRRSRRSLLRKNHELFVSTQILSSWIHPRGQEQERLLSPLSPIAKYGVRFLQDLWFEEPPDWREIKCIRLSEE